MQFNFDYTVRPLYKDHSQDPINKDAKDKWSLCRGSFWLKSTLTALNGQVI